MTREDTHMANGKAKKLGRLQAVATVDGTEVFVSAAAPDSDAVVEAVEKQNPDGTVSVLVPDADGEGFGLKLTGAPDVLDRLGKSLLGSARRARGGGDVDSGDEGGEG